MYGKTKKLFIVVPINSKLKIKYIFSTSLMSCKYKKKICFEKIIKIAEIGSIIIDKSLVDL